MSSRDAAIRRVLFWIAMLTGAALVSLQFACDRPQTSPAMAGFAHAGRWPMQRGAPAIAEGTPKTELVSWGAPSRGSEKPNRPSLVRSDHPVGNLHQGVLELARYVSQPTEKLVSASVEPAQ